MARQSPFFILVLATCAMAASAQPVTFVDEQVIRSDEGEDGTVRSVALSPDGGSLLYVVRTGAAPQQGTDLAVPAQPVIRRLDGNPAGEPVEFRPRIGKPLVSDFSSLSFGSQPFSRDGKLLLFPECAAPDPRGYSKRRPILVCQTATGNLARTDIRADLRYGRIDGTGKLFVDVDGSVYSLVTGRRVRKLGYQGLVQSANPVAPLLLVNTGMEGLRPPYRVIVWNLRDDRLLATLPTNFNHPYTDDVLPEWTSDGTYVYFVDVTDENDPEEPRITKVWNVKTGQLVGQPFREAVPMAPGPLSGSMFLRQWRGEGAAYVLHHAETGTRVELPLEFDDVHDAVGEKIAYRKSIDGKPHLCVATVKWNVPGARAKQAGAPARRSARG